MADKANKESRILDAIFETATDFHKAGMLSSEQMHKYEDVCLETSTKAIYLDADVSQYLAMKCQDDESLQALVNSLLRKGIEIAKQVGL